MAARQAHCGCFADFPAVEQGSRYHLFLSEGRCEVSFVLAAPEALATAASDLAGIGSTLGTASAAVAAPTTGVLAAAADEVSAQVAALFSGHGLGYQQLSARLAAFHEQFVQALTAGASTYATAEANAAQTLVSAINAPAQAVLGHPLIGSAAATAGAAGNGAGGIFSNFSNAVSRIETALLGNSAAGLIGSGGLGALLQGPTGGIKALTAAAR
jgi:PE family